MKAQTNHAQSNHVTFFWLLRDLKIKCQIKLKWLNHWSSQRVEDAVGCVCGYMRGKVKGLYTRKRKAGGDGSMVLSLYDEWDGTGRDAEE